MSKKRPTISDLLNTLDRVVSGLRTILKSTSATGDQLAQVTAHFDSRIDQVFQKKRQINEALSLYRKTIPTRKTPFAADVLEHLRELRDDHGWDHMHAESPSAKSACTKEIKRLWGMTEALQFAIKTKDMLS